MVLKGHKYGIKEIKVMGDLVVSIGDENDRGLLVWETISPSIISANLMKKSLILGIEFLNQKLYKEAPYYEFITFGTNRHLKVWKVKVEKDQFMTSFSVSESGLSKVEAD